MALCKRTWLNQGFSLTESLVGVVLLTIVIGIATTTIISYKSDDKGSMAQSDNCTKLASHYMDRLAERGLTSHPLEWVPMPTEQAGSYSDRRENTVVSRSVSTRRVLVPSEVDPRVSIQHLLPNDPAYDLIQDKGAAPLGLRNSLLVTGVMATVQAVYNSNAAYCNSTVPRGIPYEAVPGNPLVPAQEQDLKWRGSLTGSQRQMDVQLGLRIKTYNIDTGSVDASCLPSPLILQPRGTSLPPSGYSGSPQVAQKGDGVYDDRGFLVKVTVDYVDARGQTQSCALERKFQHQRKVEAPNAPSAVKLPGSETPSTCANTAAQFNPSAALNLQIGYAKNRESAGAVILCRDRSLRLRPQPFAPDDQTMARGINVSQSPESCISRDGVAGGLSANGTQVASCLVRRAAGSTSPWSDESAAATASAEFYLPPDVRAALVPGNVWVPCEQLEICRVAGVGSLPAAQLQADNGRIYYDLQYSLRPEQAGCYVHIDMVTVDIAGNRSAISTFADAVMDEGAPGDANGYCRDTALGVFATAREYINCRVPYGDGNCPCYIDRYWEGTQSQCVDVGNGYYSADEEPDRHACTNGPGGATVANSAAQNFQYTSPGRGLNRCDWECAAGFSKVASPASCIANVSPTPTPARVPDCWEFEGNECAVYGSLPGSTCDRRRSCGTFRFTDGSATSEAVPCSGGPMTTPPSGWRLCATSCRPSENSVLVTGVCDGAAEFRCQNSTPMGTCGGSGPGQFIFVRTSGNIACGSEMMVDEGYCCCPSGTPTPIATPIPTPTPSPTPAATPEPVGACVPEVSSGPGTWAFTFSNGGGPGQFRCGRLALSCVCSRYIGRPCSTGGQTSECMGGHPNPPSPDCANMLNQNRAGGGAGRSDSSISVSNATEIYPITCVLPPPPDPVCGRFTVPNTYGCTVGGASNVRPPVYSTYIARWDCVSGTKIVSCSQYAPGGR